MRGRVRIRPRCARFRSMNPSVAIIIGAALIAGSIAVSHRYTISAHRVNCNIESSPCSGTWRVDEWTGKVEFCEYANTAACYTVTAFK